MTPQSLWRRRLVLAAGEREGDTIIRKGGRMRGERGFSRRLLLPPREGRGWGTTVRGGEGQTAIPAGSEYCVRVLIVVACKPVPQKPFSPPLSPWGKRKFEPLPPAGLGCRQPRGKEEPTLDDADRGIKGNFLLSV